MRLIAEVFGRAWMLEFNTVKMVEPDEEQDEGFQAAPPVDPHSVGGCMVEHAMESPLEVQHFSGAGVYPLSGPGECQYDGFGFGSHGSKS